MPNPNELLVVGSVAAATRASGFARHPLKDVDFIATHDAFENILMPSLKGDVASVSPFDKGKKMLITLEPREHMPVIEVEMAWPGSTGRQLIDLVAQQKVAYHHNVHMGGPVVWAGAPSLDVLFALKSSHRFLRNSPHFSKTRRDWLNMRSAGAKVPAWLEDWLKAREKETYWYKHPNLSQSKTDFFKDDGIKYVYDHDTIHLSVARHHSGQPAYSFFLKDGCPVAVDKNKFFRMGDVLRLNSVIEEATVLALERSQIPHPGVLTPDQSFRIALMKVCTSITSGWWRDYAYEVYDEALAQYNHGYLEKFHKDVASGLVKPFKAPLTVSEPSATVGAQGGNTHEHQESHGQ
jgi:hypothetical protein